MFKVTKLNEMELMPRGFSMRNGMNFLIGIMELNDWKLLAAINKTTAANAVVYADKCYF